jgi:ribonuclease J
MEICTIGGYEQVGKNMTAVKVGEEVVIFDMGFHLPAVIELQDESKQQVYSEKQLRRVGGIPEDRILDKLGWTDKVKAIVIGHAHLDHVAAAPYIAYRYKNAPIIATPFTMEVMNSLSQDEKIRIPNKQIILQPNATYQVPNSEMKIEFIHTTHSTIQCVFVALHTKEGIFFYALDFKFDNYPTLGAPPNYARMKQIGDTKKVKAMVVDALYSSTERKPGGERIALNLLEEAFSKVQEEDSAFFITTFSSHIERLNNIVKLAKKTKRRIVFLGRSLNKYVFAAEKVGMCPFMNQIQMLKYRGQINSFLKRLNHERGKYIVVCTGHQAEDGSILDRISKGKTPFMFKPGDNLIFSSSVIPVEPNIESRQKMDAKLRRMGVRLQTDVHVHGHGSRENLREILELVRPEHVIPSHGTHEQEFPMLDLAKEFGYKVNQTSHLVSNGDLLKL